MLSGQPVKIRRFFYGLDAQQIVFIFKSLSLKNHGTSSVRNVCRLKGAFAAVFAPLIPGEFCGTGSGLGEASFWKSVNCG